MEEEEGKRSSNHDCRITWEGCSVLLDINGGDRLVFARLSPSATVKIGDKKCSLKPLVGCPFGSLFQVENGSDGARLVLVSSAPSNSPGITEEMELEEKNSMNLAGEEKDNRALIDDNKAQGLSGEDINAMRRFGASGREIIEALISNSSTFEQKTVFSQEKYKLKKQKKYAPKILLRRPFSRSICEAYFKKHPTRTGFLRVDTLALLLSMANVVAYSDVLVVDMVGGILTGAVAERLGGTGHVCCTYFDASPYSIDIVRMFNFNDEICTRIVQTSSSSLLSTENRGDVSDLSSDRMHLPNEQIENPTVAESKDMVNTPATKKSVAPGKQATEHALKAWKQRGFNSLIIAMPDVDPLIIIECLLPLLSFSSPFAVYHQYLQPLATCMNKLQTEKKALGLQISESWMREYQVLPLRTHPHMQMSASGGYILSGIRIVDS